METQATKTETKKAVKPQFERKARIGVNPLTIEEGETIYLEVKSKHVEVFERRNDDPIDFVKAVNLETGEEGHFWLSGQLKYQFNEMIKTRGTLEGMKFEICHKGQKQMEIPNKEGKLEKVKVNQFDIYELN